MYIKTSKTRARIMSQPKERAKLMIDRRYKTQEKHEVTAVDPINGMTELEIHESMDEEGEGIKESMRMTREVNEMKRKAKAKAQDGQRRKIAKERIEKMEKRDRKSGLLQKAEKTRDKKRRKK